MNKIVLAAALGCSLLAGCATQLYWIGPNAARDAAECSLEAASKFAPAMYSQQVGTGYTQPSYTNCSRFGSTATCTTTGGNYVPPVQVTSDANENARNKHAAYCMITRGNRQVSEGEYRAAASGVQAQANHAPVAAQSAPDASRPDYAAIDAQVREFDEPTFASLTPTQQRIRFRAICRDAGHSRYGAKQCVDFRKTDR